MCSLDDNDKIGLVAFDPFVLPFSHYIYPNIILQPSSRQKISDIFIIFNNQHKARTEPNQKVDFLQKRPKAWGWQKWRGTKMTRMVDRQGSKSSCGYLPSFFLVKCQIMLALVNFSSLLFLIWKRLRFEQSPEARGRRRWNHGKRLIFRVIVCILMGSAFV